jgi:hypothetical protein
MMGKAIVCPACGLNANLLAREVLSIKKNGMCLGCMFEVIAEKWRNGDKVLDEQFGHLFVAAAAKRVNGELEVLVPYHRTEFIMKLIDEALDEGNKEEFLRLSKLLSN